MGNCNLGDRNPQRCTSIQDDEDARQCGENTQMLPSNIGVCENCLNPDYSFRGHANSGRAMNERERDRDSSLTKNNRGRAFDFIEKLKSITNS